MRKLVNGKIVDIQNIDIFEKAAEGVAINRTLTNVIPNESLDLDFSLVEQYIDAYKRFYSSLPFPLYGIDTDLKYCSAGLYIKKSIGIGIRMWTNNGLFISVDNERCLVLGFVNNSWGIVCADSIKDDNINIQDYKGETAFEDFVWVLASLFKGENTSSYYHEFMPKFVDACNSQPVVMKWELSNILTFGQVPNKLNLPNNKLIDTDKNLEYTLDVFIAGTRQTKEKQHVWNLTSDEDEIQPAVRPVYKKVYGYDLYVKPIITDDVQIKPGEDKIKPVELYGVNSLFCTLCTLRTLSEADEFEDFTGIISDNNFVFSTCNRIFVAKARNYVEAKEVARGVEIYSYKQNIVYFVKPKMIAPGIRKEVIYSYSLVDGNLRLCKIQFVRV